MLRRRILASAMASVMALGSVAVVAQAETAEVKSKADLEKLVNETYGDTFRTDALSEYGTASADNVLDALEAADAILFDEEATSEDYTVAYKMVEATVAKLVIHTADELQALIDESTSIYESNNIYNEELQDLIYDEEHYQNFCNAYENALTYVTSTSSSDITEAYDLLATEKADVLANKKAVVSKSMFRSIMKQYEAIIADEFKYEDWRRGTLGWTNINTGNFWAFTGGTSVASYGVMWEAAMACNPTITAAYESIDAIKNLARTSDVTIVSGYKMAQDVVAVFNSWTVDTSSRATKAGVNSLLKQYHNVLVADYATTEATELYNAIAAVGNLKAATTLSTTIGSAATFQDSNAGIAKMVAASWSIKPQNNVFVPVDKDGYCVDTAKIVSGTRPDVSALPEGATKWQMISKNTNYDILKLVRVTADMVTADKDFDLNKNGAMDLGTEWPYFGWGEVITGDNVDHDWGAALNGVVNKAIANYAGSQISLATAYALAMDYLDGDKKFDSMTDAIDTTGIVADNVADGTSKEWALVYRYLNYALQDKYSATVSDEKYTKADVKGLIDDCYDLAELTGDAAIFNVTHVKLVDARQIAIDWLKNANSDKMYKEYTGRVAADGKDYVSSTDAYKALKGAYDNLMNEYNAMKYSFGDIYDDIAEISEQIDDGELEATADLTAALKETAYCLSVIADEITDGDTVFEDNPAFDVDRVFQPNNRLITNTGDAQAIALVDGSIKVTTKDGANPTHAALHTAYEALLAAVKAQTEVTALKGDVDGNGTVNALDASALLINLVNGVSMDAAVADYDANGSINALDASAILIAIVNA